MSDPTTPSVWTQLDGWQALARLLTDAPIASWVDESGHVTFQRPSGHVAAVIYERPVAQLLTQTPAALRTLTEALGTIYSAHRPRSTQDPTCVECGRPSPCHTRELLEARLLPRPRNPR
ncbi:MAG: hypothetical protein GEU98_06205 [Pseudonocardiaceae bacterium]|nr:hypothetical protein [Pseudonocardiaceae bacterium]